MSMEGPGPSRQETSAEHIPTKEEVLLEIAKHCENPIIKRELSDEKGIYLLETEISGEKSGETIEYIYHRKGNFPNQNASAIDTIEVLYSTDGIPHTGFTVAEYDPDKKIWENRL